MQTTKEGKNTFIEGVVEANSAEVIPLVFGSAKPIHVAVHPVESLDLESGNTTALVFYSISKYSNFEELDQPVDEGEIGGEIGELESTNSPKWISAGVFTESGAEYLNFKITALRIEANGGQVEYELMY